MGTNTKEVTNTVTRGFLNRWNVRKDVDLTQFAMWETPQHAQTVGGTRPYEPEPVSAPGTSRFYTDAQSSRQPGGPQILPPDPVRNVTMPALGGQEIRSSSTPLPIIVSVLTESPRSAVATLPSISTSDESAPSPCERGGNPTTLPAVPVNSQIAVLVQRVVATRRIEDYRVLIVGHRAVISASDVLGIVKKMFKSVDADEERSAVLSFVHTWVLSGFLEISFFSQVLGFVNKHLATSPALSHRREIREMKAALERPSFSPSHRPSTGSISESVFSASSNAPGKPRRLRKERLNKMESEDFVELARALRDMELENWMGLSLPLAVQSLKTWQDDPRCMDYRSFSPFVDKVNERLAGKSSAELKSVILPDTNVGR